MLTAERVWGKALFALNTERTVQRLARSVRDSHTLRTRPPVARSSQGIPIGPVGLECRFLLQSLNR